MEAKFRALDDIVTAGRATTLYVAPQRTHCFCHAKLQGAHSMRAHAKPLGVHFMRERGVGFCPMYSLGLMGKNRSDGEGGIAPPKGPRRRCDERHWSGFYLALLARSHCISSVALAVPGCEGFPMTFARDLPKLLLNVAFGPQWRTKAKSLPLAEEGLRWTMGPSHPCVSGNLTATDCLLELVATGMVTS